MSKYNSKSTEHEGIKFDSEMERDYYLFLLRTIPKERIVIKPKYTLIDAFVNYEGKKVRATTYEADYVILNEFGQSIEVIDVKGFETADFKIKKKLFEYRYNKKLTLITKNPDYYGGGWTELSVLKKNQKENPSPRAVKLRESKMLKKEGANK